MTSGATTVSGNELALSDSLLRAAFVRETRVGMMLAIVACVLARRVRSKTADDGKTHCRWGGRRNGVELRG
jgi:hypothetical protein